MYGIHLSISEQIILMVTLMVASKGMAGVPGVSIVVLLTTLGAMGLPKTRARVNYRCRPFIRHGSYMC